MKMEIRKGQPYVLLLYVMGILMIGFAFAILMNPLGTVYNNNHDKEIVQGEDYQQFFTRSRSLFLWLPLILLIPTFFWALSKAQEKNYAG